VPTHRTYRARATLSRLNSLERDEAFKRHLAGDPPDTTAAGSVEAKPAHPSAPSSPRQPFKGRRRERAPV